MLSTGSTDSSLKELSVSAWFYRNRTIAGFDNPARSLYVSVRELVENALDACEEARVLPDISISLRRESPLDDDEDLFAAGPQLYCLTVQDNGTGICPENAPKLLGKMLTGTKYTQRQSRGTFGLGGSLALLYGQITTQNPIEVKTEQHGEAMGHKLVLQLDIEANEPIILEDTDYEKNQARHGTTVSYHLKGDWLRSKRRIIDYFKQTSIIAPYASLTFYNPDQEQLVFKRVTSSLPAVPSEMKPHPEGIDLEMLKKMLDKAENRTLAGFMRSAFHRVGKITSENLLNHCGLDAERTPSNLTTIELKRLMRGIDSFEDFLPPSASALSPAGEDVLSSGIQRLSPQFFAVCQRKPSVYEGHPFIVEVGVAYGGEIEEGLTLYRFANRIPLLYDEGSDVSNKVMRDLNLGNYDLDDQDKLAFFTHICSTRIPYKTVGKEYIGNVDSIRREIDLGFKQCLREIATKVRKKHRARKKRRRKSKLKQYYRFISKTLTESTEQNVAIDALFPDGRERQ
ncbi:MAG: DNA topoisomerase VI subunit B [Promethearchaeia archaeon]